MNGEIESILWILVGLCNGIMLMAYGNSRSRKKEKERNDEMLRMAKNELDEANSELIVKQNIIDSLSAKVQRQQKTIDKQKRMLTEKKSKNDTY